MWPSKYKYDVFISHAVEDKLAIANELCEKLESAGLRIWYSGKELKMGDSVEQTIQKGLVQSRYGVVILSPTYLVKNWTIAEFYILLSKEINRQKVILPVLYQLTMDDLKEKGIHMTDKWGISYEKGMDYVVKAIVDVIKGPSVPRTFAEWIRENAYALKFWFFIFCIVAALFAVYYFRTSALPSREFIEAAVSTRIKDHEQRLSKEHQLTINSIGAKLASLDEIQNFYTEFMNLKSYFRNEYEFTNGVRTVRSKKNVEPALNISVSSLGPHNNYNFTNPLVYSEAQYVGDKVTSVTYSLVNTQPLHYEITDEVLIDDGKYEVVVTYGENLRYLMVSLIFPEDAQTPKRHEISFKGFLPREKYVFIKEASQWHLKSVE